MNFSTLLLPLLALLKRFFQWRIEENIDITIPRQVVEKEEEEVPYIYLAKRRPNDITKIRGWMVQLQLMRNRGNG
jgi:hypothetical protein